jgi:hypothetical protein
MSARRSGAWLAIGLVAATVGGTVATQSAATPTSPAAPMAGWWKGTITVKESWHTNPGVEEYSKGEATLRSERTEFAKAKFRIDLTEELGRRPPCLPRRLAVAFNGEWAISFEYTSGSRSDFEVALRNANGTYPRYHVTSEVPTCGANVGTRFGYQEHLTQIMEFTGNVSKAGRSTGSQVTTMSPGPGCMRSNRGSVGFFFDECAAGSGQTEISWDLTFVSTDKPPPTGAIVINNGVPKISSSAYSASVGMPLSRGRPLAQGGQPARVVAKSVTCSGRFTRGPRVTSRGYATAGTVPAGVHKGKRTTFLVCSFEHESYRQACWKTLTGTVGATVEGRRLTKAFSFRWTGPRCRQVPRR